MKNTEKFKVVMISSEKANPRLFFHCPIGGNRLLSSDQGKVYHEECVKSGLSKPQHLYIVSDEKVREGDYCKSNPFPICGNIEILHCSGSGVKQANIDNCKKIIATTDKTLCLPIIPDQFLANYIKSYNEGNQINEVELEMEDNGFEDWDDNTGAFWVENLKVKVNPENMVIIC